MKISYFNLLSLLSRIGVGVVLVLFGGGFTEVQILPRDVGIITQLSGVVTYQNEENQKIPEKAQAFMKIMKGDYLQLEAKALVHLVYFRNGRKEIWKGPVDFMVGEGESKVKNKKGFQSQPVIKILPTGVLEGVRQVPALLQRAGLSRSGYMQVRGLSVSQWKSKRPGKVELAEIATAKENYQKLRKQTKADDLTPEAYLLGILANYDQLEEMEKVIQDTMKKQPDNEVLKKLEEWVKTRRTEPTKK